MQGMGAHQAGAAYFDICCVETVIPLQSRMMSPVSRTATRNRVRVRNIRMAFHGGNLFLADFHVTLPLESSMFEVLQGSG